MSSSEALHDFPKHLVVYKIVPHLVEYPASCFYAHDVDGLRLHEVCKYSFLSTSVRVDACVGELIVVDAQSLVALLVEVEEVVSVEQIELIQ